MAHSDNEYRPATGTHKSVNDYIKKINSLLDHGIEIWHLDINPNFVSKGVRTNGWQQLSSVMDHYNESREYLERLQKVKNKIKVYEEGIELIVKIIEKNFDVCDSCKGKKGTGRTGWEWDDCPKCRGIGMIAKGKGVSIPQEVLDFIDEYQDINNTYTENERQLDTRIDYRLLRVAPA